MTEVDSYRIPLSNHILQEQVQKRMFGVLDVNHGYNEMK